MTDFREIDVVQVSPGDTKQPAPGVTLFTLDSTAPFLVFILSLVNDCGSHRPKTFAYVQLTFWGCL